jgi:hypothetical protein
MKALIIGGDRHGEWVDVLDGAQVWVDIRNAAHHRLRQVTNNIQDPATGKVTEAWRIRLAVHEGLLGPQEPTIVSHYLTLLTMNEFYRKHGDQQDIPHEPAGSELVVPNGEEKR